MKKILVIDDELTPIIENLVDALTNYGYYVNFIQDLRSAYNEINNLAKYDLIVIDLMMPIGDSNQAIPHDNAESGYTYLKTIENNFKGIIAVLTNAKKENHPVIISNIEQMINTNKNISLFTKYETSSIKLFSSIVNLLDNGPM